MARLIRLLSTSTVKPSSGNQNSDFNRKIELTPSDHQFLCFNYMHRGLLFNKTKEIPVEYLKATLSHALDRLYPLAGRLVSTQHEGDVNTVSFHIECNGAGAMFVHAEAIESIRVADILEPLIIPTKIVDSFFSLTEVMNHQAASSNIPLLAVQVTELTDGVYIGVSINHCVLDGTICCDFFNIWSELTRGDSVAISRRADFVFGRESFNGVVNFPIHIPSRFRNHPLRALHTGPVEMRVFRFSNAQIMELKEKANTAVQKHSSSDRDISSLQALMAHLWVCITRSRGLHDDDKVCYMVAMGMRSRLQPPLPRSYFGNAVLNKVVTCTAGELLRHGMGWAAQQINKAIATCDRMQTREFFDYCASPPDLVLSNLLITGGSPRFDFYGNDFGWGRPLAFQRGFASRNGLLSVSPGSIEGTIDFEATLLPENFRALAGDPEFTRYISLSSRSV